jgi:hypothetical protein
MSEGTGCWHEERGGKHLPEDGSRYRENAQGTACQGYGYKVLIVLRSMCLGEEVTCTIWMRWFALDLSDHRAVLSERYDRQATFFYQDSTRLAISAMQKRVVHDTVLQGRKEP